MEESLFPETRFMNGEQIFVDTNILVYAHDADAKEKHKKAKEKVRSLWSRSILPSVSIQVLQGFYVNLLKKNISLKAARETVADYLEWDVIENSRSLFLEGIQMKERWDISFWDALILAAAIKAKAVVIWSEDFNEGQDYDGIVVVNPLR